VASPQIGLHARKPQGLPDLKETICITYRYKLSAYQRVSSDGELTWEMVVDILLEAIAKLPGGRPEMPITEPK